MGVRERQAYAHRKQDDFQHCYGCKRSDEEVTLFMTPDRFTWQFSFCQECYFDRLGKYPDSEEVSLGPDYEPFDLDA